MDTNEMESQLKKVEFHCKRAKESLSSLEVLSKLGPPGDTYKQIRKLIQLEIKFLNQLRDRSIEVTKERVASTNVDHLEAIVHALECPLISNVSSVMHHIRLTVDMQQLMSRTKSDSPKEEKYIGLQSETKQSGTQNTVFVDAVCLYKGRPSWLMIYSSKQVRYNAYGNGGKGTLERRLKGLSSAAKNVSPCLQPEYLLLWFTNGIQENIISRLQLEYGAESIVDERNNMLAYSTKDDSVRYDQDMRKDVDSDGVPMSRCLSGLDYEWVIVDSPKRKTKDVFDGIDQLGLQLRNDPKTKVKGDIELRWKRGTWLKIPVNWCSLPTPQASLIDDFRQYEDGNIEPYGAPCLVNLDSTALIAMSSDITNGEANRIANTEPTELKARYRNMWKFILEQARSELQDPLQPQFEKILSGKQPIACTSTLREFTEILETCGSLKEKQRASSLLLTIRHVPDMPSLRFLSVKETGKIKTRHKVMAGTGDSWQATTLTANMAFVRAVQQQGLVFPFVEHRPRALLGSTK